MRCLFPWLMLLACMYYACHHAQWDRLSLLPPMAWPYVLRAFINIHTHTHTHVIDMSSSFVYRQVLATNRPGDLDDAVLDRMDEALEFGLPSEDERAKILALYLDRYIARAGQDDGEAGTGGGGVGSRLAAMLRGRKTLAEPIEVRGVGEAELRQAARLTQVWVWWGVRWRKRRWRRGRCLW